MNTDDKKALALYSGLALLFIYPLIQAGVFYRDDLDRAITGQYGWRGLGRPVADILMRILSASGHYNLDLFPFTMMASCLLLGASCLLLSKHLVNMDVPHSKFIAAFLIFNPYLLQNIAYRYDSLGMALAFLLAVHSYTYRNNNAIRENAVKIISGILSLTLYQPCTNIFIGLLAIDILILAFNNNAKNKQIVKLMIEKVITFVSFYVIYMIFLSPKHNSRAELIKPTSEGVERFIQTIKEVSQIFSSYFHDPVYIYFLIPLLVIVMLVAKNVYQRKIKLTTFAMSICLSCLVYLASLMGPTIFLKEAPVLPRTLVSFHIIFMLIAISIAFLSPKMKYVSLLPVITAFAFSAQLSSALKSQAEYEDFVFNMISRDLIQYHDINKIITTGQLDVNERARLIVNSKPLIGYFLTPATQFLASFQLMDKGFIQTTRGYVDEADNTTTLQNIISEGIKPTVSNAKYSIYIKDDLAIVKLGNTQ